RKAFVLVGYVALMAASVPAPAQTTDTIPKFTDTGLDDSIIVQSGGKIGVGSAPDPVATFLVNNPLGLAIRGGSGTQFPGISGISGNGRGIAGISRGTFESGASGVFGFAPDSIGVLGQSTNSIAVWAASVNDRGLVASSTNGDHIAAGPDPANPVFRVANNG